MPFPPLEARSTSALGDTTDQNEIDRRLLELLPPEGLATLAQCVDDFLDEQELTEPSRVRLAAALFSREGADPALPDDRRLVALQMAVLLRKRAAALTN